MSTTSTQYLIYASLLLGSIGTFHALQDQTASDANALSPVSGGGDIASLSARLEGLERWKEARVNAARSVTLDSGSGDISQSVLDRLGDVEFTAEGNTTAIGIMETAVDQNTSDVSDYSIDHQEQISKNKSEISRVELKADTTEDTLTNILTPRVDTVEGDITDLETKHSQILQRVKTNENAIEGASAARETIGESVTEVSGRVTDNTQDIQDIVDDLEGVYSESIKSNKDNIAAVAGDFASLSEVLVRSGDNIVCTGLLDVRNGANISLDSNYLRLGLGEDMMVYMGSGEAESGPSGEAPCRGWGYTLDAFRVRVPDNETNGFIIENSSEKQLLSIRGSDGIAAFRSVLRVDEIARIFRDRAWACFGHNAKSTFEDCAIKQHISGQTRLAGNEIQMYAGAAEKNLVAEVFDDMLKVYKTLEVGGRNVDLALTQLNDRMDAIEKRVDDVENDAIFRGNEINLKNVATQKVIYSREKDKVCIAGGHQPWDTYSRFTVHKR